MMLIVEIVAQVMYLGHPYPVTVILRIYQVGLM
jgi:hypothetical protein